METKGTIFWNVDTQIDFMDPGGKLYVPGAESIKPNLAKLTRTAKKYNLKVVNTADYHFIQSAEISSTPDYIKTFPPHCMALSSGAKFIPETDPELPIIFYWNQRYPIIKDLFNPDYDRNIIILKDNFDVFKGNPNTVDLVTKLLDPERIIIYGVTTNVCVDKAVCGLNKLGYEVWVVNDAIKELPGIPLPFDSWKDKGIKMISTEELVHSF